MSEFPRHLFQDDLMFREQLATDRTILANERTLLAYVRTALTMIIVGVSLLKFFNTIEANVLAWILIPAGTIVGLLGYFRFHRFKIGIAFHTKKQKARKKAADSWIKKK